jgi:hypothetical protein
VVTSAAGLVSKSGCTVRPSSNYTYRPTFSSERACHIGKTANSKISSKERKENRSRVPDGGLTPKETGRMTVGPKITLNLTLSIVRNSK